MNSPEIETVRAFNDAITAGAVERMAALMSEDHTFIDSGGTVVTGREQMTEGWRGFFRMFPDYRNTMEGFTQDGKTVMAHGYAEGTYHGHRGLVPENRIRMPAAWRAVVEGGLIREWQVYADWTEGRGIIEEDERAGA